MNTKFKILFIIPLFILLIVITDIIFNKIDIQIIDISLKECPYNKRNIQVLYDISEAEYEQIKSKSERPKVVVISAILKNKSWLKKYDNVKLEFNDGIPDNIIGNKFDMGGASGIVTIDRRQEVIIYTITALVNTDNLEKIKHTLYNTEGVLTGRILGYKTNISKVFYIQEQ